MTWDNHISKLKPRWDANNALELKSLESLGEYLAMVEGLQERICASKSLEGT